MSKFAFYTSLKPAAKRAFNQGNGKHGKYSVDGDYIAVLDESGRAMNWIKVIRNHGQTIVGIPQC